MSENNTPKRPDGMGEGPSWTPMTTPMPPAAPTPKPSAPTPMPPATPTAPTSSTSTSAPTVPRVEVEPTPAEPAASADAAASRTRTMPHAQTPPDFSAPAAGTGQETLTRTVVKTKTKKLPIFITAVAGFAVGAVLVIALTMTGAFRITDSDVQAVPESSRQTIEIDPEDTTLPETVAAKALPSVVSITAQADDGVSGGVGSGVILDEQGNILTNYHVIEGASELAVSVDGGESYEAELVGSDPSSDLAVIRLKDAEQIDLLPIERGDSDDITVGEWVMAIGSPFGNEQSVSTGIVSALYRSTALPGASGTSIYANMIQTDAAINPGNSGGALVNDKGELIGINSVIESYSGSSSGVGFAIPVNYAIGIADQIIDGETPVHPYLGVTLTSVNAIMARRENLGANEGAMVVEVADGGPAAEAELQPNDIITKIDDTDVASADSLIIAMRSYNVGDTVKLTVVRGAKELEVEVTLGSDEALQAEQEDTATGEGGGNSITEEEMRRYLEEYLNGQR